MGRDSDLVGQVHLQNPYEHKNESQGSGRRKAIMLQAPGTKEIYNDCNKTSLSSCPNSHNKILSMNSKVWSGQLATSFTHLTSICSTFLAV